MTSLATHRAQKILEGERRIQSEEALEPVRIRREEFTHRGRRYVAVRFCRGRVEVYGVTPSGLELFMGYARPSGGGVHARALDLLGDRFDRAGEVAAWLLATDHPHVRNVRIVPGWDGWGGVRAEQWTAERGWREVYASIRLYDRIACNLDGVGVGHAPLARP